MEVGGSNSAFPGLWQCNIKSTTGHHWLRTDDQGEGHMLRKYSILLTALAFFSISVSGCGGSKTLSEELPLAISAIAPAKGLSKKIGIVLGPSFQSAIGREVGDLFLKTLIDSLHDEDRSLELVTAVDGKLPPFLSELATNPLLRANAVDLAMKGRKAGYQGLMMLAVSDIRVFSRKTGIFWFRKLRYFISLTVTLDLYDPFTAGKIVGALKEITLKISEQDYDAFQNDEAANIEKVNDVVVDLSEDWADLVTETLEDQPWQSAIIEIRADRFILPAGLRSGLHRDDRLAVFEGRRVLDGQQGERFFVPGRHIADIHITDIDDQEAEAAGQGADSVQVGDIVVPVR